MCQRTSYGNEIGYQPRVPIEPLFHPKLSLSIHVVLETPWVLLYFPADLLEVGHHVMGSRGELTVLLVHAGPQIVDGVVSDHRTKAVADDNDPLISGGFVKALKKSDRTPPDIVTSLLILRPCVDVPGHINKASG